MEAIETQTEQIKKFTHNFFANLKCNLEWKGEILVVSLVPKDFEEFIGKKGPYLLSFSPTSDENAELLVKGSYLLKAMASYMERHGQTTLTKLNFNIDPPAEIQKRYKINATIANVTRKNKFKTVLKFTFMSTLQYLNEKEQIMNNICIEDGNIIDFDLSKYSTSDGKKEEITISQVEESYAIAKNHLKEKINPTLLEISSTLKKKLEKELSRIKAHHDQQRKELDSTIERCKSQIVDLEQQKSKSPGDLSSIEAKIKKLQDSIKNIENLGAKERIEKEEQFFLTDEMHKHSLNLSNKLMNTTIIYYPIETWIVFFKSPEGGRMVELIFDPLQETLTQLLCDECKNQLKEVSICSSGHLSCPSCLTRCFGCTEKVCLRCSLKECAHCSKKLCKRCTVKCSTCSLSGCSSHLSKDTFTGKYSCTRCLVRCSKCSSPSDKGHLKACPVCNRNYCLRCLSSLKRTSIGSVCTQCAQECNVCARVQKKENFPKCKECKFPNCNHSLICLSCRQKIGVKQRA